MNSKKIIYAHQKRLRKIPVKLLISLVLISAIVAILALRNNNIRMIELRSEVYAADESGEGVEAALSSLRDYVHSHMNTNLNSGGVSIRPPIQLKHTYERLTASQSAATEAQNQKIIDEAPAVCEARFGAGRIRERAACVDQYIQQNTVTVATSDIPKELYQFDFVSPAWSPDLAGYALVFVGLFSLLLVWRVLLGWYYAFELK